MDASRYQGFIFDLDGVLWHGQRPVAGAPETITRLRTANRRIIYLTNNAGRHHTTLCQKLNDLGFSAAPEEVVNAGYATARYLKKLYGPSRVHVMGTEELAQEMTDAGHTVVERGGQFVTVGIDFGFTYQKLDTALQNILQDGGKFVACNEDPRFPMEDCFRPGAGALVEALAKCAGRRPDLVVGKPHRPMMEIAIDLIGLPPDECLLVGDSLGSDIAGGDAVGTDTALVLTGNTQEADVEGSAVKPTYIIRSVADLSL